MCMCIQTCIVAEQLCYADDSRLHAKKSKHKREAKKGKGIAINQQEAAQL